MHIRPATSADLPILRDIERAAGRHFAAIGMTDIADDEPPSIEALDTYRRAGHAWVAADPAPVAYLIAEPVDGNLHIEQVSVHPDHAHQRLGARLIDTAGDAGYPALTLTTFRDVPFNAPYYQRLGFRILDPADLTPGLRRIRLSEADRGLDPDLRVCMRRDNPLAPGTGRG